MEPGTQAASGARQMARLVRIICYALGGGALLFAALALSLEASGRVPLEEPPLDPVLLLLMWAGVTLAAIAAAAVALQGPTHWHENATIRERARNGTLRARDLMNRLVIGWALLESVALLGITVFLLSGQRVALYVGLGAFLLGLARTYPKDEWFAPFSR
ncbi:MAG: hypothetical protein ACRELD_01245 [Longimicrobiales bacterium]